MPKHMQLSMAYAMKAEKAERDAAAMIMNIPMDTPFWVSRKTEARAIALFNMAKRYERMAEACSNKE